MHVHVHECEGTSMFVYMHMCVCTCDCVCCPCYETTSMHTHMLGCFSPSEHVPVFTATVYLVGALATRVLMSFMLPAHVCTCDA